MPEPFFQLEVLETPSGQVGQLTIRLQPLLLSGRIAVLHHANFIALDRPAEHAIERTHARAAIAGH